MVCHDRAHTRSGADRHQPRDDIIGEVQFIAVEALGWARWSMLTAFADPQRGCAALAPNAHK